MEDDASGHAYEAFHRVVLAISPTLVVFLYRFRTRFYTLAGRNNTKIFTEARIVYLSREIQNPFA